MDHLELEDDATSKRPLVTTFELNETLYAEAGMEGIDVVYLWLGCVRWVVAPFVLMVSPVTIFS